MRTQKSTFSSLSWFAFALIILFFSAPSFFLSAKTVPRTSFAINRGVNLGLWLSQVQAPYKYRAGWLTEKEVMQLSQWGFDHFRLPVDEVQLFHEDGSLDMEAMNLAENAIRWAKKYNMRVVFDFHILRSHFFNAKNNKLWTSEDEQERFCKLWTTAAKYLNKYSVNLVAFEVMNEPVAPKDEDWNIVSAKVIKALRKVNSKRVIVLASNMWDSVDRMANLAIPDNDPNIMLTFHFYEPMVLTHYQASWTELRDVKVSHVQYPGRPISEEDFNKLDKQKQDKVKWFYNQTFDKEWMRSRWQKAVDVAEKHHLTLYLGEFGCLPTVGETSRIAWINDVVALCNELHIPRAYWEYKSGFGFANGDGSLKNTPLMNALVK